MTTDAGRGGVLLASCLGSGAGLLARDGDGWRRLDELASTGLVVSPDGEHVARALWTSDDPQTHGELVVSDRTGVRRYSRVDELQEPHGLLWDGDLIVAVSTLRNRLLWIDGAGRVVREQVFPGEGDAWHLNCPAWADGRLVVTAFGRHRQHRDWARTGAIGGKGVLLDVASSETIATGFSAPHDPIRLDDGWVVCDSATGRVLRLDDQGRTTLERDLGGWTRGAVIEGALLHVGVSARRHQGDAGNARIATLRLADLTVLDVVHLPCEEVFALALVPEPLVGGLEVGFSVNPAREVPLGAPGDRLGSQQEWSDLEPAVSVRLGPVATALADRFVPVELTVTSEATQTLFPVGEASWKIGARWLLPDGGPVDHGARARLGEPLLPGRSARATIRVRVPEQPGHHVLEIGLLQEGRRWHATARAAATVTVTADDDPPG